MDIPAAQQLIDILKRHSSKRPVSTVQLSAKTGYSDRTIRLYLKMAEERGFVWRPKGPKSGWAVKPKPVIRVQVVTIVRGQLMLPGF